RARARHLRVELRSHTLDGSTIKEYLLRIRHTVDELTSIGDAIPIPHHIDVILEGLPSDYAPVISVIESRFDILDLDEVEVLLMAHELRLNKFKKQIVSDVASLNLTHANPPPSPSTFEEGSSSTVKSDPPHSVEPDYNSFRGGRRGGRGGRGGRGRGGRNSDLQCQVCSKTGHSALDCWHRFDQHYQSHNAAHNGSHSAPRHAYGNASHFNPYGPPPVFGYGNSSGVGPSFGYPNPYNVWMKPQPTARPVNMFSATPSAFITNAGPSTSASWFPDSGASYHVTSDPSNLQQSTPFEGHDQIYIGNGQGLHISSAGTSTFPSPLHPNYSLKLNNLLLVPSITKNLISATDAVLLKGRVGSDGLYEFQDLALHSAKSLPGSITLPSVNSVSSCT
ncbi:retrovirus-related Pol polyprotein from transposon TNT 1-94, partial [Trifolium medium]|nr:retrovirus-related Pol polyprotein from transposon TNT 1-94 [Trifolium medium]